ncbi:hypothetical protein CRUP_023983 [Coryphaenoides rupestris]|nr:hypothetical protein CRUP_023983 [Coryphaenoides rupestris]
MTARYRGHYSHRDSHIGKDARAPNISEARQRGRQDHGYTWKSVPKCLIWASVMDSVTIFHRPRYDLTHTRGTVSVSGGGGGGPQAALAAQAAVVAAEAVDVGPARVNYVDALMGVCYDGVEGLLYLSLFSLMSAAALSALLCDYDDIDEEDPFNPQARRLSYNPGRSNIHSFCSYNSSLGSQGSLRAPAAATANG